MKCKKGQVTIFIIVALVLVSGIVLVSWLKDKDIPEVEVRECEVNADCIPKQCCDAFSCVGVQDAVDCTDADCEFGCDSRAGDADLGCNQGAGNPPGQCVCVNQNCEVSLN